MKRAPTFHRHVRAHEAVVTNEFWYGDGPPTLGKSFTAGKTAERQAEVVALLLKAAKKAEKAGDKQLANAFHDLADKLHSCRPRARCGSLACPKCARAFQKAKVAAQEVLIPVLKKANTTSTGKRTTKRKKLVMATVVPIHLTFKPADLPNLDIHKRNRWLKDVLSKAGFTRVMLGSADLSWENGFYQLHWHIGMFTSNRKNLTKRLKKIFPGKDRYDRRVLVSTTWSLGFVAYMNKAIKLPQLLRTNRTHLPELLLVLDRTEPLDLMVLMGLRPSAQSGRLVLGPLPRKKS